MQVENRIENTPKQSFHVIKLTKYQSLKTVQCIIRNPQRLGRTKASCHAGNRKRRTKKPTFCINAEMSVS